MMFWPSSHMFTHVMNFVVMTCLDLYKLKRVSRLDTLNPLWKDLINPKSWITEEMRGSIKKILLFFHDEIRWSISTYFMLEITLRIRLA